MLIDPYFIKRLPKWHHRRLLYTLSARLQERYSAYYFEEYALPLKTRDALPPPPDARWGETQVEPEQARYLLAALQESESHGGCVVEVGAWRGETTAWMAANTKRPVVAIDPWIGDRNEVNYRAFLARTAHLDNVFAERKPFGQAIREWSHGKASFAFIDAAHDYVNVAHDLAAVQRIMVPGGIMAFHDTDNVAFAGCRRALYEKVELFEVVAHITNLVILRNDGR
ncbi:MULTISPECIES: class I SAM-dependent methyltransferase [unclassified Thiocapsa]|uniref:class I SAM-dependent methyltransferase n=1 Tax=unclassified Thiocapsa TaxID=2641286 RepID=UPI0035AEABAA